MKDKISREEFQAAEEGAPEQQASFDDLTAPCDMCGEENVGMGVPVMMTIPGMLFPSREYDVPIFVPDPDAKFQMVKLPNGTIGFVTDDEVVKYAHTECYDQARDNLAYDTTDEDEDDEDDEEEEDVE